MKSVSIDVKVDGAPVHQIVVEPDESGAAAAVYPSPSSLKNLSVNGGDEAGGGFPTTAVDEIVSAYTGGNPDGSLPSIVPSYGEILFLPPTEESTNFVAPMLPYMDVREGKKSRVIPLDIRTCLHNTPANYPLFEPVKTNGWGMLSWRYIGEDPIHSILSGSLDLLTRIGGTSGSGSQLLVLELCPADNTQPHLETGEGGGIRYLGTSMSGFTTAAQMTTYDGFNDRFPPIDSEAVSSLASSPELYVGSDPGYIGVSSVSAGLLATSGTYTTKWMDISAYDNSSVIYALQLSGQSRNCRVQYKTGSGAIIYYNAPSYSGSSAKFYRFPAEAKQVRIYYNTPGDTAHVGTVSFKALSPALSAERDVLKGYWVQRSISVCRDVVFWPGTVYCLGFRTDVYGGANAREWGFRFQSGGLRLTFDASRIRKKMAKNLFGGAL